VLEITVIVTISLPGICSKAMGCLYVERAKSESQNLSPRGGVSARVVERMNRIAEGNELKERPILLFPEGTTTNGQFLLPFKSGAFLAGEPLQPVILRYGTKRISPSWESIVAHRHIILMLLNIFHSVTCYKLPVYYPSEKEKKDPQLYAANVRKAMLTASGLKPSTQTYIDKVKYNDALRAKYGYYPPGFPTREPTS
jgi:lysophosphatidylcholine acyltransferase/lyso-PAF acetyltransferase